MTLRKITEEEQTFFKEKGYLTIHELLNGKEVLYYQKVYNDFLSGEINTEGLRSDLSGLTNDKAAEKITQIMRPATMMNELLGQVYHKKTLSIAQQLLGEDMALDFDMLIAKAPHTNTPTPWHQDEAYWLNMPDKRACTCWMALDQASIDNGCMWYVAGSHKLPVRKHIQTGKGGALKCELEESEGTPVELAPGSCTFHAGRTLHYSRGNSTGYNRRAFILNFRPSEMIRFERERGYDHLGERSVKNK